MAGYEDVRKNSIPVRGTFSDPCMDHLELGPETQWPILEKSRRSSEARPNLAPDVGRESWR